MSGSPSSWASACRWASAAPECRHLGAPQQLLRAASCRPGLSVWPAAARVASAGSGRHRPRAHHPCEVRAEPLLTLEKTWVCFLKKSYI